MAGILDIEKGTEAADRVIAGSCPVGRRRRSAPVVDAGDTDMAVALRPGVEGIKMQGPALLGETAPEPTVKRHIAGHVIAQHARSPGQGWAIFCSMGMSTLA